jgi:hypothetical protein
MIDLALVLIVLHSVDGREVTINPEMVTSLHATTEAGNRLLNKSVRCRVGLADGKFVSAVESCDAVRQLLEGK